MDTTEVAGMDSMFDVMKQSDVVFTATGSEVQLWCEYPEVEEKNRSICLE